MSLSLKTLINPSKLVLEFSNPFPELFDMLPKITTISLSNVKPELYSYKFIKRSSLSYFLEFSFLLKSTKSPRLNFKLNVPISILYHATQRLITTELNITMKSFFDLDFLEMRKVESAEDPSFRVGNMANIMINVANLVKPQSSLSFRGKLIVDTIQFLR